MGAKFSHKIHKFSHKSLPKFPSRSISKFLSLSPAISLISLCPSLVQARRPGARPCAPGRRPCARPGRRPGAARAATTAAAAALTSSRRWEFSLQSNFILNYIVWIISWSQSNLLLQFSLELSWGVALKFFNVRAVEVYFVMREFFFLMI